MDNLLNRAKEEISYLGNGIIKADSFINHQLYPNLITEMGTRFAELFKEAKVTNITRVVTAEVSGIAPAFAVAQVLNVPMVFARKKRPATMVDKLFEGEAPSHTKGGVVKLFVSSQYLKSTDQVLLIDDFLATGYTVKAMVDLIAQSGATLCGVGCVIEKVFEDGRNYLRDLNVPIITLVKIDLQGEVLSVF